MTEEMFNVLDRDYGMCHEISSPRKIRTKSSSFGSIFARFNEFRLQLLQNKLEQVRDKALSEDYSRRNLEKQINKSALSIAKLEEKVMILSKENVPENFVANRALKLRNNMFQNLIYNCNHFYSIDFGKRETIFEDSLEKKSTDAVIDHNDIMGVVDVALENENEISPVVAIENGNDSERIEVVPGSLERQQIEDAVNSEFASMADSLEITQSSDDEIEEYNSKDSSSLRESEASSSLDESFGDESIPEIVSSFDDNKNMDDVVEEDLNSTPSIIAVDEQTPDINEQSNDKVIHSIDPVLITTEPIESEAASVSTEDIKKEIDDVIERIRVSRNGTRSAKISRYETEDENTVRTHYDYVPMTDEEIRDSQEKVGLDESGHFISKQSDESMSDRIVSTASVVGKNITPFDVPNLSFDAVFSPTQRENKISETQLRGDTVVVPERELTQSIENDWNINSDSSDASNIIIENDSEQNVSLGSEYQEKRDEYNLLKERISALQQKKNDIRRRKLAAQEAADAAEARASEAKKMFDESQMSFDAELERLRAFTAELENDCNQDLESVELAERVAKEKDGIADRQRKQAGQNYQMIEEINSFLNSYVEDGSHKSK